MTKEFKAELIELLVANEKEHRKDHWRAYWNKDLDDVFKIGEYYFPIEKQSIKKSFCFGHGWCGISSDEESKQAYEMSEKARTDVAYFLNENLEKFNETIAELKYALIEEWDKKEEFYKENENLLRYRVRVAEPYLYASYSTCRQRISLGFFDEEAQGKQLPSYVLRKATKEELELILAQYEEAKKRFIKRLNTYLKKYGLSKIHSWTYLVD